MLDTAKPRDDDVYLFWIRSTPSGLVAFRNGLSKKQGWLDVIPPSGKDFDYQSSLLTARDPSRREDDEKRDEAVGSPPFDLEWQIPGSRGDGRVEEQD